MNPLVAPDRPGTSSVLVDAEIAERGVRVAARLPGGQVTAVLGPNGSGKSTLLHLISGLLRPSTGTVTIGDQIVASTHRLVPPHRRPVALLEQRALLFPHLSVLDNVAFGPRARRLSRADARARAASELEQVGAGHLASRRPGELSGGEAQRVALARALASDPRVILLDEPFASLDLDTAAQLRHLLADRLPGTGAVVAIVTHDPLDVWSLADQVICLDAGTFAQSGSVTSLFSRPPTPFLAAMAGVNLLRGRVEGDHLLLGDERLTGLWDTPPVGRHVGQHGFATCAPAAVALFPDPPHGSPRNTWPVSVTGLDPRGATVRVALRLRDGQPLLADLTAQSCAELGLRPGTPGYAQVKATQVTVYTRAT